MRTFLKKCPACGKDHRSFNRAMKCFLPVKNIYEWMKTTPVIIPPPVFAKFEMMRRYLFSRFGCE